MIIAGVCIATTIISSVALAQQDRGREEREQRRKRNIPTERDIPEKAVAQIIGTWRPMEAEDNTRTTDDEQSVAGRTLVFNRENQYLILEGDQQLDSGSFRMNEPHSIIYMESSRGGPPRLWKIDFSGDMMTMQSAEPSSAARDERKKYMFQRSSN